LLTLENKSSEFELASSKERYQANAKKIRSGLLKDSAEVVYDLILMNKKKSLSSSEKQLFNTAYKFLVEEVSVIKNISEIEATSFLNLNLN
jgi:CarD family transcriptional regulator